MTQKKASALSLIGMSVFVLDLLSKHFASAMIEPLSPVRVTPFFNLVNVHNAGAAFSMLAGAGNTFFVIIATAAIAFILYLILKGEENPYVLAVIMGGAAGNLADRIMFGYVRDFLDFHLGDKHWPAFNVADSALTVGVIVLLATMLFKRPPQRPAQP